MQYFAWQYLLGISYFSNNISNRLTLTASCKSIKGYFLKNVTIGIPKISVELFNSNLMLSAEAMITEGFLFIYLKNKFM